MFLSEQLFRKLLREGATREEMQTKSCQAYLKLQSFPVSVYDLCWGFVGVFRCFIMYPLPKGKDCT